MPVREEGSRSLRFAQGRRPPGVCLSGDQRGMADFDAFHVRDRIECPRFSVKWHSQVASPRLGLRECDSD